MTNRLTPVGSWPGAEARFAGRGVFVQIVEDDIVGDVARGGREVAPRPETLPQILACWFQPCCLIDFPSSCMTLVYGCLRGHGLAWEALLSMPHDRGQARGGGRP